jgi:hypothetical protein
MHDPRERIAAQLATLDAAIAAAAARQRGCNGEYYRDPDSNAIAKLLTLGAALVAEYHAHALTSAENVEATSRGAAIAELEAVLAVWREVSDEAWLAARLPQASAVAATQRNGVVRRRKPGPTTGGH